MESELVAICKRHWAGGGEQEKVELVDGEVW